MKEGDPLKLTGIPVRKPHENDAIPKIAPKWLKHDKQVKIINAIMAVCLSKNRWDEPSTLSLQEKNKS
jgi:hypothetical protein